MTAPSPALPTYYNGDGSLRDFPAPFFFEDAGHVRAAVEGAAGVDEYRDGAGFVVIGDAEAGFTVRFDDAPPAGESNVVLWREEPARNVTKLNDLRRFPAAMIELIADRIARAAQDAQTAQGFFIRLAATDWRKLAPLPALSAGVGKFWTLEEDPDNPGGFRVSFSPSVQAVELVAPIVEDIVALNAVSSQIAALGAPGVVADMAALAEGAVLADMNALAAPEVRAAMAVIKGDFDLGDNSLIRQAPANAATAEGAAQDAQVRALLAGEARDAADLSARDAGLASASAAVSSFAASERVLKGKHDSAAGALAANPLGQIGARYVGTDNAIYTITSLNPPASTTGDGVLSPEQSANLAAIPALQALAQGNADQIAATHGGFVSTGTGGTYAVASPAGREITELTPGMRVAFRANHANPGASTLTRDGVGPAALRKYGSAPLALGDIVGGQWVEAIYDGAVWQIVSALSSPSLRALAGVEGAANRLPYFTAADQMALAAVTDFGRTWLGLANVSAGRSQLGLGTLAFLGAINNGNWSGADLAVANGGTGASSAAAARNNLDAQQEADFVWANPGRIELVTPGGTLALQWGRANVSGNSSITQNFSRSFISLPYAVDGQNGSAVNDSDNVNAFAVNNIGMALVNGTGSTKSIAWLAAGRVQ